MKLLKQDDAENLADSQNNSQTDDIIEEETNMEHSSITPESNKDDTQGPSISAREESPKPKPDSTFNNRHTTSYFAFISKLFTAFSSICEI
ncbi:unnamed protein product [Acanthoscelides obtectus]|uniref:Uncharacterized protein n=1 Tax=Acanthoscelides obtectus TaxID=200917 RepID=A0A9P0LPX4_ACAOB|nr:unnamed protein product [Acanthoscelides obtectus]CAK1641036.1 hypothetical protein AOBTE_LOCUS12100 [Acanthoscelides obtectus]